MKRPCILAGCLLGGSLVGCQTPLPPDCSPYLQRDLTIAWATRSYWPTACPSDQRLNAVDSVESPQDSSSIHSAASAKPNLTSPDTGVTSSALICVDGGC